MALYRYFGRDHDGKEQQGELEATSEDGVASELLGRGITPIRITALKSKTSVFNIKLTEEKVKFEDLMAFCRQMRGLVRAGVPIVTTLVKVEESTRSRPLKAALKAMAADVSGGKSLSVAMHKHPKIFSAIFFNIIEAGEDSGRLDLAFDQVTKHLSLEANTRQKVKSATRYPILVISTLVIAFFVVNVFVIPAFSQLYAQFKGNLPFITRMLVGMSNFTLGYWYILALLVVLLIAGIYYFSHGKNTRPYWDKLKLRVPIFGPIIQRVLLGRFSRTFSMMIKAGVPITRALALTAKTMDNAFVSGRLLEMLDGVEKGKPLSQMAKKIELFPPLVVQMISVGEDSGSIDTLLEEVADYYEREVDYDLGRLSDLIEPILLIIMGALVLVFALGVFLPIWDMINFIQR